MPSGLVLGWRGAANEARGGAAVESEDETMKVFSLVDEIVIRMREKPAEWRFGECRLLGPDGIEIWVGSGWSFLYLIPRAENFSVLEKLRLWREIRRLRTAKLRLAREIMVEQKNAQHEEGAS